MSSTGWFSDITGSFKLQDMFKVLCFKQSIKNIFPDFEAKLFLYENELFFMSNKNEITFNPLIAVLNNSNLFRFLSSKFNYFGVSRESRVEIFL